MLRFEGNTAAFLMYAYVRIQGIKRRIQDSQVGTLNLIHPSEVLLGLHLARFADLLHLISEELMPHYLCDYLYELAEKI